MAQAYVGNTSASQAAFDDMAKRKWSITPTPNYPDLVYRPAYTDNYTMADIEVPSFFIASNTNAINASLTHWKKANDVVEPGVTAGGVTTFHQRIDSDKWGTQFWNGVRKSEGLTTGFMKVAVKTVAAGELGGEKYYQYTKEITDFLKDYAQYDRGYPYGNHRYQRADYKSLGIQERSVNMLGTEYTGVSQFRSYYLYIPPDLQTGKKIPLVIYCPGNGQAATVGMDNGTMWWYLAGKEKFAYVIFWQPYATGAANLVTVTHNDSVPNLNHIVNAIIKDLNNNFGCIDEERIYLTGHSAGSGGVGGLARSFPEKFAGVTNHAGSGSVGNTGLPIPGYIIVGESESSVDADKPNPWSYATAYIKYLLDSWKLDMGELKFASTAEYKFEDTVGKKTKADDIHGRWTWIWSINYGFNIPVVMFSHVANRSHDTFVNNCFWFWNFLKHFKITQNPDGTQTRYYSPSAFTNPNEDLVVMRPQPKSLTGADIKTIFKGGSLPSGSSVDGNGFYSPIRGIIRDKGTLLDQAALAANWTIVDWYPKTGDGWEVKLVGGKLVALFEGELHKKVSGETTVILKNPAGDEYALKVNFTGENTRIDDIIDEIVSGCNAGVFLPFLAIGLLSLVFMKKRV
jgi:hypothetical protein